MGRPVPLLVTVALVVMAALAAPGEALAQTECDAPPTTADMRRCQEARLVEARDELDRVVAELLEFLDGNRSELLRRSQAAWEEHRAAHCRWVGSRFQGGSLQAVVLTSCFADLTSARSDELERQLALERGAVEPP